MELPNNAELAADFPQGDDLVLLMRVRDLIRTAAKEDGFTETGCGVGCGPENSKGSADVGLRLGGTKIEVQIFIPSDTN